MVQPDRPPARLYLVTPPTADPDHLCRILAPALADADIAAVLLRLEDTDERTLINRIKTIAPAVQKADVALILDGRPQLVARGGADGAHLTGIEAFDNAVESLKPDRIAGASGLDTRHDAMLAAEHGADYVMFGEPDAEGHRPSFESILDRVGWWAEVFQVPCTAYAAAADEVAPLARAGADFIAIGEYSFADPRGLAAALGAAMQALTVQEPA